MKFDTLSPLYASDIGLEIVPARLPQLMFSSSKRNGKGINQSILKKTEATVENERIAEAMKETSRGERLDCEMPLQGYVAEIYSDQWSNLHDGSLSCLLQQK